LQDCGAKLLQLEWRKGSSPAWLEGGTTSYTGCISCEDVLTDLCEVKHGRTWVKRGGGGSGGRGWGGGWWGWGRGRGRGRGRGP
jgi:DNA topoisomerase-3